MKSQIIFCAVAVSVLLLFDFTDHVAAQAPEQPGQTSHMPGLIQYFKQRKGYVPGLNMNAAQHAPPSMDNRSELPRNTEGRRRSGGNSGSGRKSQNT